MNAQKKFQFSGVIMKIGLAVALVIGALVILSGVLLDMNKNITVQSRTDWEIVKNELPTSPMAREPWLWLVSQPGSSLVKLPTSPMALTLQAYF